MTLPARVARDVEVALEAKTGKVGQIQSASPVGGGCINPSARVQTDRGDTFFLKWNPSSSPEMFAAEADGLEALAHPGKIRVPEVLGHGGRGTSDDPGWLLLEFIPKGRQGPDYGSRLGEELAALHDSALHPSRGEAEPGFGWHRANFIGSLDQENDPSGSWTAFWRDRRLEPQLRMARDGGYLQDGGAQVLDTLLNNLDQVMTGAQDEGPALLHGDLWSGNYYPGPQGEPVLIDPAVYRGVGEVDLAMMELFGSLPRGFPEAYGGLRPLAPAYGAFRRDLYQLYYLLVHVNLFGGGYVGGTLAAARRALEGA